MDAAAEKEIRDVIFPVQNPVYSSIRNTFKGFSERRESIGLKNPGTVEGLAKEVQRDVLLNSMSFSGLRADLTKAFSISPMFHIQHALSSGSQALPPYTFNAMYGSPKVFLQGNIDNDLQMSGRANYRWSPGFITKTAMQVAPGIGQSMVSIENDYTGADFTASLKTMNPSILENVLTGTFVGSYLQSVTPGLALGLETLWQRDAGAYGPTALLSYAARYKGDNWIGSAQLLAQGGLQVSYWRRLSEKVEAGMDLNLRYGSFGMAAGGMMGMPINEGLATMGAKYDFRASSYRAQIDSQGRVACLLDRSVAPAVRLTFSGEMDYSKNQVKLGLGVSIEAADEEVMKQQESAAQEMPPPV